MAFRTAPSHFASKKARLYIISSPDLKTWKKEGEIHMGADLREPRFFVFQDTLYFYFFRGGKRKLKFEPQDVWYQCTVGDGIWSASAKTNLDGYVPWRFRVHENTVYLSAYYGKDLYQGKGNENRLFKSEKGREWHSIAENPQLKHQRSVEEAEFIFDHQGDLWGVARLEFDGAYLFHAKKEDLSRWDTIYSPFKYDSSLLFEHDSTLYLIARRNLDGDGRFAKNPKKPKKNLLRYSLTKKRTALFRVRKEPMQIEFLIDFPSTGDNAFPGIAKIDQNTYLMMNYSSDIHKKEKNWISGQLGKTYIYMSQIKFNP